MERVVEKALKYIEGKINAKKSKTIFKLAISGGKTPQPLLQALSFSNNIDWSYIEIFMTDERLLPHNHIDSNYRFLYENLIKNVGARAFHYIDDMGSYSLLLKDSFDLIVLGMGEDGHIASIFPDPEYEIYSNNGLAVKTKSFSYPYYRVSISMEVINSAKDIILFIKGKKKLDVLKNKKGLPIDKVSDFELFSDSV